MAATWEDVRAVARSLPETTEDGGGTLAWRIRKKSFAWERPLRKADLAALGDAAPTGEILGVCVPDLGAKEALLAEPGSACFTTPHFDGYPAVLVQLELIELDDLRDLLVEAWLDRAPKRLAAAFLAS